MNATSVLTMQQPLSAHGIPRFMTRPFLDHPRLPYCRAPDEPNGLIGGGRIGVRDVSYPYWPTFPLAPPFPPPPPMGMLPGPMAEENDCFALGEKLLKKPKRIRTRVDAGEPRNPYAVATSFSSLAPRPPSLFSAFLPPGPHTGMLSEIFKADAMGVLDKVTGDSGGQDNVLLREILQGRKLGLEDNNNSFKNGDASPNEKMGPPNGNTALSDDENDSDIEEALSPSPDPKKNRLENIVSVIRSSPTPPVNGCKKRKLYLPQQHEAPRQSPALDEPEPKTRRVDEDPHNEGNLEIDLRSRPESAPVRPPSTPKPPSSSLQPGPVPSCLFEYAQRLLRNQRETKTSDLGDKLHLLRTLGVAAPSAPLADLEGLADVLKTEITASLAVIIDSIVNKYVQQRKAAAVEFASHIMEAGNTKPGRNGVPPRSNHQGPLNLSPYPHSENNLNSLNLSHLRPPLYKPPQSFFPPVVSQSQGSPYNPEPEQDEALSLVVTPKKKRHKVTDSRLTSASRTVGRLLEELPRYPTSTTTTTSSVGSTSPRSSPPISSAPPQTLRPFPQPPPLLPVSLPTSVAIPNPSLHDTGLLYPSYYSRAGPTSPDPRREESPATHPPPHHPLLHPAFLAASSPDSFSHLFGRPTSDHDRASDCSPADPHFDGMQPMSFYSSEPHSSTLTPMHLRKAKLMFFYVRYPSSSVLKTFFPDIKFNKNNTAQLVKWFSNFREFYYIQMEKYARQSLSEGVQVAEDIKVGMDSEIIRVLNLHYNRNNHLEIPEHFQFVVEQTEREFFKALQEGKDQEQSWKKAIYKIIARMDETVPEYFKSPTFLEQLE